ncbi:MAG TPA: S-layer homology domain-containing protein, partial [Chloroflexia bacterium]|nr:S-layer homology domain-containing protein [Chloroflexia bacterium]
RIVAAGDSISPTNGTLIALARYQSDGSLDPSFGTGGRVMTRLPGGAAHVNALALQLDGRIIVAGEQQGSTTDFAVARYLPGGSLDPGFGSGGLVFTDFQGGADTVNALVVQSDGRLLVAGTTFTSTGTSRLNVALARYLPNGSLDPSFGTGGQVVTSFGGAADSAQALAVQSDGRIVVAGAHGPYGSQQFLVARYLANGTLDASFGTGGQVVTSFGGTTAQANALTLQLDGKIVAGGVSTRGGLGDFALARYLANGSLDPAFGSGGLVLTDFAGGNDLLQSVASQPDGNIVAAGSSDSDFALARYQANVAGAPTDTPGPPTATATAQATPTIGPGCLFADVCPSDYFFTPVQYLVNHGALSGYGDNTFRPYNNTTRAQLVKIMVLGFQKPIVTPMGGASTFADVPPTHPFFAYVETAAADTIVSGYACGHPPAGVCVAPLNRPYFLPYANVTRGQLSKIDVVAAGWTLVNPATRTFEDVLAGTAFYSFVETAVSRGVISGYTCGSSPAGPCVPPTNRPYFLPGNNATRGQIAKIGYLSILSGPVFRAPAGGHR